MSIKSGDSGPIHIEIQDKHDRSAIAILTNTESTAESRGLSGHVFEKFSKFERYYLTFTYNREQDRLYKETMAAQKSKDKEYIKDVLKLSKALEPLKPKDQRILSPSQLANLLEDVIAEVKEHKYHLQEFSNASDPSSNFTKCSATLQYLEDARQPIEEAVIASPLKSASTRKKGSFKSTDNGSFKGSDTGDLPSEIEVPASDTPVVDESKDDVPNVSVVAGDSSTKIDVVVDPSSVESGESESKPFSSDDPKEVKADEVVNSPKGCQCIIM